MEINIICGDKKRKTNLNPYKINRVGKPLFIAKFMTPQSFHLTNQSE